MENLQDQQTLQKIELMLNTLTRPELIAVNRMAIHRIKIMDDLFRLAANSQFQPGQRVEWKDNQGLIRQGFILRINTKTISVQEDKDDGIWKISASLLTRI